MAAYFAQMAKCCLENSHLITFDSVFYSLAREQNKCCNIFVKKTQESHNKVCICKLKFNHVVSVLLQTIYLHRTVDQVAFFSFQLCGHFILTLFIFPNHSSKRHLCADYQIYVSSSDVRRQKAICIFCPPLRTS